MGDNEVGNHGSLYYPHKSLAKVIFLGDSGVGKTRYTMDEYQMHYKATIGSDFLTKELEVAPQKYITLQIWDTAGQERFRSLGGAFYRGSDVCVLVYDVMNPQSFRGLVEWQSEFLQQTDRSEKVPFVVVGNKIDEFGEMSASSAGEGLEEDWVSTEEAQEWCTKAGMQLFLCSAKDNKNVDEMFQEVARLGYEIAKAAREFQSSVALGTKPIQTQTKSSCC